MAVEVWRAVVEAIQIVATVCEVCHRPSPHPLQPNHVRRRSAGGGDHPDNVILLCSVCHAWLDAPYGEPCGRLRIEALGEGRFACQVQRAVSRQAAARGEVEVLVSFQTRGRTPFVATE